MPVSPVRELAEGWRGHAAHLRRYGAESQAAALEACADELEAAFSAGMSVNDAADLFGVTRRTIERRMERGELENIGRPGEPRVKIPNVTPDGPRLVDDGIDGPDIADEILQQRY